MSVLNARHKTKVAYLSSLREVSVIDATTKKARPIEVPLRLEPSIIALGTYHVAAAMNNRVFYHTIDNDDRGPRGGTTNETEYPGTVRDVQLSATCAVVQVDNKVHVHPIDQDTKTANNKNHEPIILPTRKDGPFAHVTCVALAGDFSILALRHTPWRFSFWRTG